MSGTVAQTKMITPGRGGSPNIAGSACKLNPTSDSNSHDIDEAQVEPTHIPGCTYTRESLALVSS